MRSLLVHIQKFAQKKFILLSGPRQVGKTTLARSWLEQDPQGIYLNYDDADDRAAILQKKFITGNASSVVLDEIHKYSRWKAFIKGIYDKHHQHISVIVTGSARLDIYQRGGDSLLGRHELFHLHPFSIGELHHNTVPMPPQQWAELPNADPVQYANWLRLEARSGFPEPYTENDPAQYQRWASRRRSLLIDQDVRELSLIRMLDLLEHLYLLLPDRVGSLLSINSLREVLNVSHESVTTWLEMLDRLFVTFRVSPYTKQVSRSIQKEKKLYLWDWAQVEQDGPRFENMCASHLLKAVQYWNDLGYGEFGLFYLRNKDKEEVDFVITNKRKPVVLFECKRTDSVFSASLKKFSTALGNIPMIQLVHDEGVLIKGKGSLVVSAAQYFSGLP